MTAPAYGNDFIIAKLKRSAKQEDDYIEMEFRSINGRQFVLRDEGDGRFFAFEYQPLGRLAYELADGNYHYTDWDGHEAAKDDPNGYVAAAQQAGIDPMALILGGAGYGVYTRYLSSIEEAAEEFAACLRENRRYDDQDRAKMADPDFKLRLEAEHARGRAEFQEYNQQLHEAAVANEFGLFKGLYGMMGPLADDSKKRILSFLNTPCEETWDDVYSLMIKGGKTMWQLWCEVDTWAVTSKGMDGHWPDIPDADMMKDALIALGESSPEEWKMRAGRMCR